MIIFELVNLSKKKDLNWRIGLGLYPKAEKEIEIWANQPIANLPSNSSPTKNRASKVFPNEPNCSALDLAQ